MLFLFIKVILKPNSVIASRYLTSSCTLPKKLQDLCLIANKYQRQAQFSLRI